MLLFGELDDQDERQVKEALDFLIKVRRGAEVKDDDRLFVALAVSTLADFLEGVGNHMR